VTLLPAGPTQVGACSAICGDGLVRGAETCDDSNTGANDGCGSTCLKETGYSCPNAAGNGGACTTVCGDGLVWGNETCDEGTGTASGGCTSCQKQAGFSCPTATHTGGVCTTVCNDFLIRGSETCDDGNAVPNDGCNSSCVKETGWDCPNVSGFGGVCTPHCNDGILRGGETCDDTNLISGDGCSSTCRIETGWACGTPGSPCTAICGDGLLRGGETCDDAQTTPTNNDGCNSTCHVENGWSCPITYPASGPVQTGSCKEVCGDGQVIGSETCDEGAGIHTAGCVACAKQAAWTCTTPNTPCVLTPVVGNDNVGIVKGAASFNFAIATLTSNDQNISVATLTTPTPTTGCGATVAVSGANVVYTPLATPTCGNPLADSFTYKVCSPNQATLCANGTVSIQVNRAPTVANAFLCVATPGANGSIDVAAQYTDPDSDPLSAASIVATTTAGGSSAIVGTTVKWTPSAPTAAGTYSVPVQACDSGKLAQGCGSATFVYRWDDPPVLPDLATAPVTLPRGGAKMNDFSIAGGVVTVGTVSGLPAGDPSNPIATVKVSNTQNGTFAATATTTQGACTVSGQQVTYTASASAVAGSATCWVEVCEACGTTPACAKTQMSFSIVTCQDTVGVGQQDPGCGTSTPICKTSPSAQCVECTVAGDCGGGAAGWTCSGANACVAPPNVSAVADTVGFWLERTNLSYPFTTFLANDANAATTLTLPSGNSTCGGTVAISGSDVVYTPPADPAGCTSPYHDTFQYRVCNVFVGTDCQNGSVTVELNRSPSFAQGFMCVNPGTASASIDVGPLFSDPDSDLLDNDSIVPGTLAGGTKSVVTSTVTWTPTTPASAATYNLSYMACDDGLDPGCASGSLRYAYNDAPTISDLATTPAQVSLAGTKVFDFTAGGTIVSTGTVSGLPPGSTDDPLASIKVSATENGTYAATATTTRGGVAVSGHNVTYTSLMAGMQGADSFWVEVCETCGATPSCTKQEVDIDVTECVDAGAGTDPGCSGGTPVCKAGTTPECVECVTDVDCGGGDPGWTCDGANECVPPPVAAVDDIVGFAKDRGDLDYAVDALLENDTAADAGTFELLSMTTSCGNTVTLTTGDTVVNFLNTDVSSCPGDVDTFEYHVCNVLDVGDCDTATVTVDLNDSPTFTPPTNTCVALDTANVTLDVAANYSDLENDLLDEDSIDPSASTNGTLSVSGTIITFVPNNASTATTSAIQYGACDDGLDPACGLGDWNILYNDAPVLASKLASASNSVPASVGTGDVTVGRSTFFTSYGTVEEALVTDTVKVGLTSTGTFSAGPVTASHGTCTIIAGALSYHPTSEGSDTCFVQVCESCGTTPVCATAQIDFTVGP